MYHHKKDLKGYHMVRCEVLVIGGDNGQSEFIDKKKTMVTHGNIFYQILLCISTFKAEFIHNWAR